MKRFLLFLASICIVTTLSAQGGTNVIDGIMYYSYVQDQRTSLYECNDKTRTSFVIPSQIYADYYDGYDETDREGYCTVKSVYDGAFRNCTSLQSIELPNTIEYIKDYAFSGCTGLKSIVIPNSVNYGGYRVFSGCTNLESVTLSTSMTCLYRGTFENCSKLSNITIPDEIQEIQKEVFYGCSSLESITIPMSVKTIGASAFAGCTKLTDLTNLSLTPQVISNNTFTNYGTLHVLKGFKEIYEAADGWKNFTIVDDAQPNNMIFYTTSDNNAISINQYETAYSWGNNSRKGHQYKNGIGVITFNTDLTTIGSNIFRQFLTLTSITLPNTVTSIGSYAFYNCKNLTDIELPSDLETIGNYAFAYCNSLRSVNLPSNLMTIGEQSFSSCSSLTSITIPGNVESIGNSAFSSCTSLNSVTIEEGVKNISESMFSNCKNITSIAIPHSVTSIDYGAFSGTGITSLIVPSNVESIGSYAFKKCDNLTSVIFEEGIKSIGYESFSQCDKLSSVVIFGSVEKINDTAFGWCSNLTDITCLCTNPPTVTSNSFVGINNPLVIHVLPGCKSAYESSNCWKNYTIVEDAVDPTQRTITLGANEYATYCADVNLDFSEVEGLKAYIASSFDPRTGTLSITRVNNVPAGEGVLLKGTARESYTVPTTEDAIVVANLLKGNTEVMTLNPIDGDYTNYVLSKNSEGKIGFYRFDNSVSMPANKAWLQIPTKALGGGINKVKGFSFVEDGEEITGISNIENNSANSNVIYDLQGRRINGVPSHGIYIQNGKKIIK